MKELKPKLIEVTACHWWLTLECDLINANCISNIDLLRDHGNNIEEVEVSYLLPQQNCLLKFLKILTLFAFVITRCWILIFLIILI